jgi:hypothetical protein
MSTIMHCCVPQEPASTPFGRRIFHRALSFIVDTRCYWGGWDAACDRLQARVVPANAAEADELAAFRR